jgi:glucose-1-phosphate thymidylyltransferase
MIYYSLSTLMWLGCKKILIVSRPDQIALFAKLLGDGASFGISIEYAAQTEALGIPHALLSSKDWINRHPEEEQIALMLGDNLFYGESLINLLKSFSSLGHYNQHQARILGYHVRNPEDYGVAIIEDGKLVDMVEKPKGLTNGLAIPGLYMLDRRAIPFAESLRPSRRGELEIVDLLRCYFARNELVLLPLGRGVAWFDTGTPGSLLQAAQFIASIQERQGLKIACLEEVAFRQGFITHKQLEELSEKVSSGDYRHYLMDLASESSLDPIIQI